MKLDLKFLKNRYLEDLLKLILNTERRSWVLEELNSE